MSEHTLAGSSLMQKYLAALTIVLLLGMVLIRVFVMRRTGTRAIHFGKIDKTDFLIPPFALFYVYTVFAAAFNLPLVSTQEFFHSEVVSWVGVILCLSGLILLLLSLISFGKSFRIGIDVDYSDKLVTTGGRICSQPQSDILSFCFCLAWAILGVPQLDSVGLPRCRYLAVPPSSIARRGIPEKALWPGVRGVLQASKEVSLSGAYVEETREIELI